jgi:hypothetical protein
MDLPLPDVRPLYHQNGTKRFNKQATRLPLFLTKLANGHKQKTQ